MADARLMDADCIHGVAWFECRTCDYRPVNSRTGEVKDMPLVDDLADVLARMVVRGPLIDHPEVQRVMARYRQDKSVPDTGAEP